MSRGDDEHVRALLDQRAQRADVPPPHTRYSIFSDRSDSPSLYSHYRNTPGPTTPVPNFSDLHNSNTYDDRRAQYPPLSPAGRLTDNNTSTLDLFEDGNSESDSRIAHLEDEGSNLKPDDDEDPETRMSLLGPKMRVHSRAPWEEEDDENSDSDMDDSGIDTLSVFGGKKSRRAVIRGLGFGSKSPAPRPSFDSSITSRDKRSFETTCSVVASRTSRSAIQALAQASMSTTSLALGPSPSSSRLPSKLSVGHLTLSRDRSASAASNTSDKNSTYPPLPSPRCAAYSERSGSVSDHYAEFAAPVARIRSPSPIHPDRNSSFHPYANPALLSAYQRDSVADPFAKHGSQMTNGYAQIAKNGSVATLAASEETVMLSHSSSTVSASIASTSGLMSTTPPSSISLVSAASQPVLLKPAELEIDAENEKHQKRLRRETKLGPISAPAMVANNDFTANTPYALISLEQAQVRVKERNRSATTGVMSFPRDTDVGSGSKETTSRSRARSSSATGKVRHAATHISVDNSMYGGELPSPTSIKGSKQPSRVGPPAGKVLRPKRSGFMKLFNGREKDRVQMDTQPPPVPLISGLHTAPRSSEYSYPPSRPSKVPTHRVPVPTVNQSSPTSAASDGKDASRSKKFGHSLSIKVTSPSMSHVQTLEPVAWRSDSPKSSLKPLSPKLPTSAPADTTQFTTLSLRPVSAFFSGSFAGHLISEETGQGSPRNTETSSLISPTTVASSDLIPSPVNSGFNIGNPTDSTKPYAADRFSDGARTSDEDQSAIIVALKEQIRTSRKAWQRQIWELEGQVRDLKAEIDELKSDDVCDVCGRGASRPERKDTSSGVIHRPRAKTGYGARFASGNED